jgi:serine phosphatase RsbU (regulator of sigma subunit)
VTRGREAFDKARGSPPAGGGKGRIEAMRDLTETQIARRAGEMLQEVLRRTHLGAAGDIGTVVAEEARGIGAGRLVLYVIDYEQRVLVPVPSADAAGRKPLTVQGTLAGRAFATSSIVPVDDDAGRRLWMPLLDGTERLGVVEITFTEAAAPLPEALVAVCVRYAHLISALIANKDLYSDFFKLLRRRQPMTTAGELVWEMVPPQVLATDRFVLAALLEPCYDVGGDAYDYALNDGLLQFAIFDAMGHGLAAAGVAAFALSAYRRSRRRGEGPAATYAAVDAAVCEQYPTSRFVTALIGELDVESGRLCWVSAGHPAPLLLRAGRLVKTLDLTPSPPLGLRLADGPPVVGEESLEPGDRLLVYTDGLTEARRPDGALFTVERLAEFIERQASTGEPAPETLRGLRQAIIERREGRLHDDATAMLIDWGGDSQWKMLPATVSGGHVAA